MKRIFCLFAIFSCLIFFNVVCRAQNYIISAYAGTGTVGYTGDGGPALLAEMYPVQITIDASGNIYFTDGNNVIRKINPSGIISTIAGTGVAGYSGDGGPAAMAKLNLPAGIVVDTAGNVIFSDESNHVIRKINTAGIITTMAGTGVAGYSGDGGPATAANLQYPSSIAIDKHNNIYFIDNNLPIVRKIDAAGIITTIAGTDTCGFRGDGGPATGAKFSIYVLGIAIDGTGNVYISDAGNSRIRKIDTTGIITTFAGNGLFGFSGDGGLAAYSQVYMPEGMVFDQAGNLFIADASNLRIREVNTMGIITTVAGNGVIASTGDGGPALLASIEPVSCVFDAAHNLYVVDPTGYRIRKISYVPNIVADSFSVFINNLCGDVQLTTVSNDVAASRLHTWFGDGSQQTDTLKTSTLGTRYVNVDHTYPTAGHYTIKELLMRGTTAIDSAHFSYEYLMCQSFALKFYNDANGNCIKDSGETFLYLPITIEVDSNGVAVDTISATSGLYYTASGSAGDIYSFKVLSCPAGLLSACMPGGMVSDTLDSVTHNIITKYIGFSCSSATAFDLAISTGSISGRHMRIGNIIAYNNYCTPENAVVTMNFSPKYVFESSSPAPSAIAGNTVSWDFTGVGSTDSVRVIHYSLTVPGLSLIPGDTIQSSYMITPVIGDVDTGNNNCGGNDTVKISFDPNEMAVAPSGYITSGTQLQHTIQFENTGNDTAFNISVYDTLSDNVDVGSLRIVAASALMNTVMLRYNGHNIVKFDFPGINLLDSSHHNLCNGMVIFKINTKPGLPIGTTIFNHAGIFFDDNAVVMTDTIENIIGTPTTGIVTLNHAPKLAVFPNPAKTMLTITSIENINTVSISNIMGQTVYSNSYNSPTVQVDISSLANGLYFVKVNGNDVRKFVKE